MPDTRNDYYQAMLGRPLSEVLREQYLALRDVPDLADTAREVEEWSLAARELEDDLAERQTDESHEAALEDDLDEARTEHAETLRSICEALREVMARPFWASRRTTADETRIAAATDPLDLVRVLAGWTAEPIEVTDDVPGLSVEALEKAREDVRGAMETVKAATGAFERIVGALLGEG